MTDQSSARVVASHSRSVRPRRVLFALCSVAAVVAACAVPVVARATGAPVISTDGAPGELLASHGLRVRRTRLDVQWERVAYTPLPPVLAARSLNARVRGQSLLQWVNAMVNQQVRPVSDQRNYGVRDYWATAAETLQR